MNDKPLPKTSKGWPMKLIAIALAVIALSLAGDIVLAIMDRCSPRQRYQLFDGRMLFENPSPPGHRRTVRRNQISCQYFLSVSNFLSVQVGGQTETDRNNRLKRDRYDQLYLSEMRM